MAGKHMDATEPKLDLERKRDSWGHVVEEVLNPKDWVSYRLAEI